MCLDDSVRKKVELINSNIIYIPKEIRLPYPAGKSTSGPSSGYHSFALTFNNKNVKMIISRDKNECFSLQKENNKFQIIKKGEIYLKNVSILPILFHAPGQAFINLDNRCIYNCAFCSLSKNGFLQDYSTANFVEFILKASYRSDFHAVALTSGIYPNNKEIIRKMCNIIKNLREKLPNIPIGVEPCISSKKEILLLKKAGVNEIKINLQVSDKYLFSKICPDLCYDDIFNFLKFAVRFFGKGKVTSNIIYGFGESDRSIIKSIENLADIGVVPTLRKIRITDFNRKKLEKALSKKLPDMSVDRIIKIAYEHKRILEEYSLTTETFETMCFKCGCCDIVPFRDI